MTPNDLTPHAERAAARASAFAAGAGADAVQPRHLLLALLEDRAGPPWQMVAAFGLPESWPAGHPAPVASDPRGPDLRLLKTMHAAREIAARRGADAVLAADHLLEAVLHADAELRDELHAAGLRVGDLLRLFAGHGPAAAPTAREATERFQAVRAIDANANRAREALRVVEDYCRFARNDAGLALAWKQVRHGLADALAALPGVALLVARDTANDVGTAIATPQEGRRDSLAGVVAANCKRLQEALRSLEEYGKLFAAAFAVAVEQLRYRAYTLERQTLPPSSARDRLRDVRLCALVSGDQCRHGLEGTVAALLEGGVGMVQLREKRLPDRELFRRAQTVRRLTRDDGAVFIVNDRPDIALLANADGVHLGQDDLPVGLARQLLGADAIIGVSTHALADLQRATDDGADYVGVGPAFPSATKAFDRLAGLDYVREACAATTLPAFVIGGIAPETLPAVRDAGGRRFAASAALAGADDPRAAAEAMGR